MSDDDGAGHGGVRSYASPEGIASILVALVAIVFLASQVVAGAGQPSTPRPSPSPSAGPSASPTMDPVVRNALATALIVNQSLARRAEALDAAAAVAAPSAPDIAAILRSVNADITEGTEAADRMLLLDETADLGADLGAFYDTLLARTNETLGTTIRNVQAHVDGAVAVSALIGTLAPYNDRIVDALARRPGAGGTIPPATPSSSASPSGTAAPTPAPTPPPSPSPSPPGSPSPTGVPGNVVANGGFEDGLAGWRLQVAAGAQATAVQEPGAGPDGSAAARVDIDVGSQARAGISLTASGLALSQGASYVIEVSVRAAEVREVRVRLTDGAGLTTSARVFPVGTSWTVISFEVSQLVSDPAVELGLDVGRSGATVWFDNVVVRVSPG